MASLIVGLITISSLFLLFSGTRIYGVVGASVLIVMFPLAGSAFVALAAIIVYFIATKERK